jgi:hypothetical protein
VRCQGIARVAAAAKQHGLPKRVHLRQMR